MGRSGRTIGCSCACLPFMQMEGNDKKCTLPARCLSFGWCAQNSAAAGYFVKSSSSNKSTTRTLPTDKLTMSGRGKGGKGLGKGGAKRHRKVLRDNIQGAAALP